MWGLFSFFKHIYNPARKDLVNSCAEIALRGIDRRLDKVYINIQHAG